jgi:hypothetical protein
MLIIFRNAQEALTATQYIDRYYKNKVTYTWMTETPKYDDKDKNVSKLSPLVP